MQTCVVLCGLVNLWTYVLTNLCNLWTCGLMCWQTCATCELMNLCADKLVQLMNLSTYLPTNLCNLCKLVQSCELINKSANKLMGLMNWTTITMLILSTFLIAKPLGIGCLRNWTKLVKQSPRSLNMSDDDWSELEINCNDTHDYLNAYSTDIMFCWPSIWHLLSGILQHP